jgi:hypothetical protein
LLIDIDDGGDVYYADRYLRRIPVSVVEDQVSKIQPGAQVQMGESDNFENREGFEIGGTPPYSEFPIGFQSLFLRPLSKGNRIRVVYETLTKKVLAILYHPKKGALKSAKRHGSNWFYHWIWKEWVDYDVDTQQFTEFVTGNQTILR